MKTSLRPLSTLVLSSSLLLGLVACNKAEPTKEMSESAESTPAPESTSTSGVTLETLDQKVSYGIGRNIGGELSNDPNLSADFDALIAGIRSGANGEEPAIPAADIQAAFGEIQKRAQEAARAGIAAEEAKSTEFLETNKNRDRVVVSGSGLQYEVLTAGTGEIPTATDRVRVHYHGTLIDGTIFDSSVDRGTPAEFGVTQVIPGWVEALQMMPEGSKWKLFVPPALGYGDRGQGAIPGGAVLVFEVELLEIIKPAASE